MFCSEYLATFKKTVAMHEVFLSRLASHPIFRSDQHLKVFLEYDQDLCAKPRKKIDLFGGLVRSLGKTTDEIYLGATVRDVNDFFETELQFLTEYNAHLKEAASRTERMTKKHKEVADLHIKISSNLIQLSTSDQKHGNMEKFLGKTAEVFEKIRVSIFGQSIDMMVVIITGFFFSLRNCRTWRVVYPAIKISSSVTHCVIINVTAMQQRHCSSDV